MRLLLAGFEPFGDVRVNPSQLLAERISASPPVGMAVCGLVLPVSYARTWPALLHALMAERPDAVLLTGLATGRAGLSVERFAVNLDDALISDNDGERRCDSPIVPSGPAAYVSTLPVRRMAAAAAAAGVDSALSLSAGSFLCNHALYRCCRYAETEVPLRCGFVHLPPLAGPSEGAGMSLDLMERGLRAMLTVLRADG